MTTYQVCPQTEMLMIASSLIQTVADSLDPDRQAHQIVTIERGLAMIAQVAETFPVDGPDGRCHNSKKTW